MPAPTLSASNLKVEKQSGILTLTLNRPDALNSLTPDMLSGLMKNFKEAGKDREVRCVILTGAGRAFCAGADLGDLKKQYSSNSVSLGRELREKFNPIVLQIRNMEKPVISAVPGVAAGAGASLALACDMKVCSDNAAFHLAFIKVGLAPDSGMSWILPRAVGMSRALQHALTGEPIRAQHALEAGLVNLVVPADQVLPKAQELAAKIAAMPAKAVALTKRAMNRAWSNTLEAQLDYEAYLQEILGRTPDHHEGITAFLEKRPPKFF